MEIPNYPSNRNSREPEKPKRPEIGKVTEGQAIERKQPFGRRLTDAIFAENVNDVGEYLFWDLAIPFIKNALIDAISEGANRMFNGSVRSTQSSSPARRAARASYTSYSRVSANQPERRPGPSNEALSYRNADDSLYQDVVLPTRGDAERTIESLRAYLEQYGSVTRSDLMQAVGLTPNFVDEKWGWYDLSSAMATRTRSGGYKLDLPDAVEIE